MHTGRSDGNPDPFASSDSSDEEAVPERHQRRTAPSDRSETHASRNWSPNSSALRLSYGPDPFATPDISDEEAEHARHQRAASPFSRFFNSVPTAVPDVDYDGQLLSVGDRLRTYRSSDRPNLSMYRRDVQNFSRNLENRLAGIMPGTPSSSASSPSPSPPRGYRHIPERLERSAPTVRVQEARNAPVSDQAFRDRLRQLERMENQRNFRAELHWAQTQLLPLRERLGFPPDNRIARRRNHGSLDATGLGGESE